MSKQPTKKAKRIVLGVGYLVSNSDDDATTTMVGLRAVNEMVETPNVALAVTPVAKTTADRRKYRLVLEVVE